MIGSKLVYNGTWDLKGAVNVEEFDATPYMEELMTQGLPWKVIELDI
jgi:saccharopine dehydrogenase (NAD+, L-lysine-forming)